MSFLSVGSIQRARRLPPQGLQVKLVNLKGWADYGHSEVISRQELPTIRPEYWPSSTATRLDEPACRQFGCRYFPKSISGRHHRAMAPIRVIRPSRFQPFPPRCNMPRPYDNAMRAIRRKKGPVR